jgi:drug/metabolite transporter (DMT)-like permease
MIGSGTVFLALVAAQGQVNLPSGAAGGAALVWASAAAAIALIAMFASARRVGPFRTALIMNAEPVATIMLSWLVLGETMNATQWAGAAIMIGSLVWFQQRRQTAK